VDVDLGNVFSAAVRKQQQVVQNCSLDRRTSRHGSVGSGDPPLVPERGGAVPFVAIAADRGCVYTRNECGSAESRHPPTGSAREGVER
jgi:hypothetical protein